MNAAATRNADNAVMDASLMPASEAIGEGSGVSYGTGESDVPTVLLVGGGSGGHIFPNVAVAERSEHHSQDASGDVAASSVVWHFVVSNRELDAKMLSTLRKSFTAVAAAPMAMRPKGLVKFARGFLTARRQTQALLNARNVKAVVATGGFVTPPVVAAAKARGIPVALVSLDAVPGKANRFAARWADRIFTVYDTSIFPQGESIGMPLRAESAPEITVAEARQSLGLDPERPVLLVTAGSQGLKSINDTVLQFATVNPPAALEGWQILHLSGQRDQERLATVYRTHGVAATVLPFCPQMGHAWRATTVAISLAGAGSVAEAWANGVPTIFFPYPYHRDQHQRLNAAPMVATDGAVLLEDTLDAAANAARLRPPLESLLNDPDRRATMRRGLEESRPENGAATIYRWVRDQLAG